MGLSSRGAHKSPKGCAPLELDLTGTRQASSPTGDRSPLFVPDAGT